MKQYQDRNWLYQKYLIEGLSMLEIGKICRVSLQTISYWMEKFEINKRTRSEIFGGKVELYQNRDWLYQKYIIGKLSTIQVAKLCDVSNRTIGLWLKKCGIKVRTISEANKKYGLFENKSWLYQKYWKEKLSIYQIAELCKVSETVINRCMDEHNIFHRTLSEAFKIGWNRPEIKKRRSEASKIVQNRPEVKKARREKSKKLWLDPEYRKKVIEKSKIAMNYPEVKKLKSKCMKKLWLDPDYRKKTSEAIKMAHSRPEVKKKLSEAIKLVQNRPEIKKKNRNRMKKRWADPEYRKRMIKMSKIINNRPGAREKNSEHIKKLWQTSEHIKKVLKEIRKRPTNPEKVFDEMTPDIVRYTGNRAWWRKLPNGKNKNPDFKITGQNKVIEIWDGYPGKEYWHRGQNPQELINLYAQAGLECLIFWEHEIYNQPQMVVNKVCEFIS